MARRFLCVSLLVTCVVPATPGSALGQNRVLWIFDRLAYGYSSEDWFTFGAYSPRLNAIEPSAVLGGTKPPVGVIGEVAVEQHILRRGDEVPLPVFADGTRATESEVFWTFSLWRARFPQGVPGMPGPGNYEDGDLCAVTFSGRTYVGGSAVISNTIQTMPPRTNNVEILVTVIAVRSETTTTRQHSWGHLKARYRRESGRE